MQPAYVVDESRALPPSQCHRQEHHKVHTTAQHTYCILIGKACIRVFLYSAPCGGVKGRHVDKRPHLPSFPFPYHLQSNLQSLNSISFRPASPLPLSFSLGQKGQWWCVVCSLVEWSCVSFEGGSGQGDVHYGGHGHPTHRHHQRRRQRQRQVQAQKKGKVSLIYTHIIHITLDFHLY